MGILGRLRGRPATPQYPERTEFAMATFRPHETQVQPYSWSQPTDELVAQASGHVYHAVSLKARTMQAQGFKLYRPASPVSFGTDSYGAKSYQYPSRKANRRGVKFYGKAAQYGRKADEIVEVTDHPALDLLHDGNPYDCGLGVIEALCLFFDLTGNGYINVVRDQRGVPVELWVLPSQYVTIVGDVHNYVQGYHYSRNRQSIAHFTPDEVLHAKKPNIFHPLYGTSWLEASLMDANIDQAQRQQILSGYLNGSQPSKLVTFMGATDANVQQWLDKFESRHRGPRNFNKIAAMGINSSDGGVEIHDMSTTPEALQLIEHLGWQREVIMARAGIPKALYASDDVNLANARMAKVFFLENTIIPDMLYIAAMLTERYLPMFGVQAGEMFFGVEQADATDPEAEANRLRTLYEGGLIKLNEAREELGKEAVPDGDKFYEPPVQDTGFGFGGFSFGGGGGEETDSAPKGDTGMKSVASVDPTLPDLTQPEPEEEPSEPVEVSQKSWWIDGDPCGCSDDICIALESGFGADLLDIARKAYADHGVKSDPAEIPRTPEAQFTAELAGYFAEQTKAIVARVKTDPSNFSLGSIVVPKSYQAKSAADWHAKLLEIIDRNAMPEFTSAAADALAEVAGELEGAFNLRDERASKFLEGYRVRLSAIAKGVNEQTEQAVTSIIKRGIDEGIAPLRIASEIETRMAEISPARALTIARSETSRAHGSGVEAGWAQSGVVTGKRWLAAPNECEFCAVADGKEAPLGEPFYRKGSTVTGNRGGKLKLDYEDVHHHPLHPNCRCAVVAVRGDDDA